MIRSLCQVSLTLVIAYCIFVGSVILFPSVQRALIYLNHVQAPFRARDLPFPEKWGLSGARNFRLNVSDTVSLGVWHILPAGKESIEFAHSPEGFDDAFDKDHQEEKIVIYLHGNAFDRGAWHRVEMYKLLSSHFGSHVIAFDYRGFGDSTGFPSEAGVKQDAMFIWNWVQSVSKGRLPVYIWGHSLGSGVAVHLAKELSIGGNPPAGLILEAPFTSLKNAALYHPTGSIFHVVPNFEALLEQFLIERYESIVDIKDVVCHVLILHGIHDSLIPDWQSELLYKALKIASLNRNWTVFDQYSRIDLRTQGPIDSHESTLQHVADVSNGDREPTAQLIRFLHFEHLSHNNIHTCPGLLQQLNSFFVDATALSVLS